MSLRDYFAGLRVRNALRWLGTGHQEHNTVSLAVQSALQGRMDDYDRFRTIRDRIEAMLAEIAARPMRPSR